MRKRLTADVIRRFWSRVRIGKTDECWPWLGGKSKYGYGRFRYFWLEPQRQTHRVAWRIANGPIARRRSVLHRCDNPPCCNPKHLFLGSQHDNMRDASAKKRLRQQKTRLLATHCRNRHRFTKANSYIHPKTGWRYCRTCRNIQAARIRKRRRAG